MKSCFLRYTMLNCHNLRSSASSGKTLNSVLALKWLALIATAKACGQQYQFPLAKEITMVTLWYKLANTNFSLVAFVLLRIKIQSVLKVLTCALIHVDNPRSKSYILMPR